MIRYKFALSVKLLMIIILILLTSSLAFAHGEGEATVIAGSIAWGFLGFGLIVIWLVSMILFAGKNRQQMPSRNRKETAEKFESLHGFQGYIGKMRLFSRNARLFMVHVVGMDVIFGTWTVMFNLYLLAVGFDVAFIGLRILLAAITRAVFSIPAGIVSDRLGRKISFILGDGGGAVMSLIAISTTNSTLLLVTAVLGGLFSSIHGVAEPAFMAENSEDYERVHLFSVSSGTRTAAAIIGSSLAGLVPLLFLDADATAKVSLYRTVAYIGIGGWFASLIPAVMLRQTATPKVASTGLRSVFAGVKHPGRIWRLTAPEVIFMLGAGFALPLLNVFFKQNLDSPDVEIGATFAAGQGVLVIGAFLAPVLVARLGKVKSVVYTRLLAIPFVLLIAFAPDVGAALGSVFTVAGLAHIARITMANMAGPVRSAFAMEILHPGERGTQVGIELALASALAGGASYIGAQLMNAGDFRTPFFLMAICILLSSILFWHFFAKKEEELGVMVAETADAANVATTTGN
ncbi:MAG: MFS transporter [Chloroflexi bacterium]|nr:MFS transporter [Chloroflexota bacterium]